MLAIGLWTIPAGGAIGADRVLEFIPLLWLLAGVIVYLLAAKEITSNAWNLHLLHVPIAMFCGHALVTLIGQGATVLLSIRGVIRAMLVVGAMLALATLPLVTRMKDPQAEAARLLGQELQSLITPGDLVIAVAPEVGDPIGVYYSRARGWVFPPGGGQTDWSTFGGDGPEAIAIFEDLRTQGARWFGVAKNAQDRQDRLFTEHYVALLAHLDATAEKVADSDNHVIYRLSVSD